MEAIATPQLLDYVDKHKEGLIVHPQRGTAKYGSRMLTAINRAILGTLELAIRYQGLADDAPKRIVIEPEALVVYDGSVHVAGYRVPGRRASAAGDGGIRFFKLDRIVDAKPSARRIAAKYMCHHLRSFEESYVEQ